MEKLTIEQKMEIGDQIARIFNLVKVSPPVDHYMLGLDSGAVTSMGVYEAFKKAADELREEGKI